MNRLAVKNSSSLSPVNSDDGQFAASHEPLTQAFRRDSSPASFTDSPERVISKGGKINAVASNWRLLVIVFTPILLLPIIIAIPGSSEAKCAYVLLLMAIYWCTEALPLPATALMPIFLVPMLGLLPSSKVCVNYLKDLNFLFVGGLMFAVAIEKWNLHKRIALGVLLIVGTKPKMLLLGFTGVTGFLSMWLSNTATTAMMIPIAHAVLVEMWKQKKDEDRVMMRGYHVDDEEQPATESRQETKDEVAFDPSKMSPAFQQLGKAVSLSICYAANIGGTGTLTGTGPNLIIGRVVKEYFPDSNDITFGSWILFAAPLMIVCLGVSWLVLVLMFLGWRSLFCCKSDEEFDSAGGKAVIRREYAKLGKVKFAEGVLIVFFVLLVLLWLSRDPKFAPGWSSAFVFPNPDDTTKMTTFVTDASTGIFICTFLFAFPSSFPCSKSHKLGYKFGPAILDWESVHKRLPWGVIILLGGGFALANVCNESGLSKFLGCQLAVLDTIPPAALVFICGLLMTLFTEFTSNTSSASIFLPILAEVAVRLEIHPLYILIPVTICSSYAFAFPVATPPNAIVFSYGHLRVIDMVKTGMLMNIMCLCCVMLAINSWGSAYFNLQKMPLWINSTTVTSTC